ncbi:hypothetical protein C21_02715 [Arenibacter sp. NBRC 103722]|nr:hypothetical protein C21_02715 [Arenibacter sp. NBRC 103722]
MLSDALCMINKCLIFFLLTKYYALNIVLNAESDTKY